MCLRLQTGSDRSMMLMELVNEWILLSDSVVFNSIRVQAKGPHQGSISELSRVERWLAFMQRATSTAIQPFSQ